MRFREGLENFKRKHIIDDMSPLDSKLSDFEEGIIAPTELSDEALLFIHKEELRNFEYQAAMYNSARRGGGDNKIIEKTDEETARVRRKLNLILAEIRKRRLPED